MSTIGSIRVEIEKSSDFHMVNWTLMGMALALLVSSIVVVCSINAYFCDDAAKYTDSTGTTYVPPEEKKSE